MVIIGGIVLIVGVVLIAVGAVEVLGSTTIITSVNQPQNGEYVSTELILNSTAGVAVSSASANGGIIPPQDLNLVNSTNIGQYALPSNSNVVGTQTYKNLTGDYYYVAFASSQPSTKIVATTIHSSALKFGTLVLGGFVVVIVGIVVLVMGVRRKTTALKWHSKRKKSEEIQTYKILRHDKNYHSSSRVLT